MSQILELHSKLLTDKHRFIDEIFEKNIYSPACPEFTIVDLGAYEGEFGFYCYNFAKEIYAVEPDPRPFNVLKDHVEKFNLTKFKLYPDVAISGVTGKSKFFASGYGGSALKDVDGSVEIDTMTLADFIKTNNIEHIDILKIDVESMEYEIFEAEDFASVANRIDKIVGEAHGGTERLTTALEPLGFEVTSQARCFLAKRI